MANDRKPKEDELLSHNYDGIEEYDNDLPLWWKYLFYITIVFFAVYVVYYEFGPGLSPVGELEVELAMLEKKKKALELKESMAKKEEAVDLAVLIKDQKVIDAGAKIFISKCAACHGPNGGGTIGPNLTDDYWIHGGQLEKIKHVIQKGVLEKGMLAWEGVLKDDEINATIAYIKSIKGSNPENPKAAQGELFKDS